MFDFHEKRKLRAYLYSPVVVIVLLVAIIALSFSVFERFKIERDMAARTEGAKEELEELEQRATVLEEQVYHLKNDRGIEEEIRSRFDVAKEGEQVVVIVDEGDEEGQSLEDLTQPPGNPKQDKKGWFSWLPWR